VTDESDRRLADAVHDTLAAAQQAIDDARLAGLDVAIHTGFAGGEIGAHIARIIPQQVIDYPSPRALELREEIKGIIYEPRERLRP
jgi:hypothetical protein